MITKPEIVVIIVVFLAIVFLRRFVGLLVRLIFFLIFVAIAAAGVTMIMNNETIWEKPGFPQRVARFVTMNSATSSTTGSGSLTCDPSSPPPAEASATASRKHAKKEAEPEPKNTRNEPGAGPAPTEDVFPELIVRGYPGISREKLFQLSQETVNSLGGWKIVKSEPGSGTLDCIYTSRIFKLEDDIRITVQPSGDIDVCSRSGLARPDTTSILRYFPGDLGANVSHIKQFYETLEPKMDEVYKEEQDKQNAKKPPH
jgi:uncharacterized protein DUF1499